MYDEWREAGHKAVASLNAAAAGPLERPRSAGRRQSRTKNSEIEEEMLDALGQVLALERELAMSRLPVVDTAQGGRDGSVPLQRSGLHAGRSGPADGAPPADVDARGLRRRSARTPALPWHATREVIQSGRDVLLVFTNSQGDDGHRFRCNSFADALCGAAIARHLMRTSRGGRL